MKKIFSLMVACAAMFAFAACEEGSENTDKGNNGGGEKTALATPVLTVTDVTNTSFVVTWEAVENAVSYMVNDGEKNNTITETKEPDTEALGVTAVGDNATGVTMATNMP